MRRTWFALCVAAVLSVSLQAQWQGYPTPGIPRAADGKPNLTAPAPKTSDRKPDLTGIWLAARAVFDLAQALKPGESVGTIISDMPRKPGSLLVRASRQSQSAWVPLVMKILEPVMM